MRRRDFIVALGGVAAVWPSAARAQQGGTVPRIPRIGVLWHAGNAEEERDYLGVLRQAFNDLGYVEGKNIELEHRFPAEQPDRFHILARELVESKVDAIVAVTAMGATAAKQATSTIPIVFVIVSDPVAEGLVGSLAHPGGNLTGLSLMAVDLSGKRLEQLKEAVPNLTRVALLVEAKNPTNPRFISAYQNAAQALGLLVRPVEVPTPDAIEQVFSAIARDGAGGVIVPAGSMMFNERVRIGASALAEKLPTQVNIAEMVPYGPLMSYGQDFPDFFRRAAAYIDKILRGAKPSDLPIEQPTRFKLVINLKTARALGLTMPPSLLVTADEVID